MALSMSTAVFAEDITHNYKPTEEVINDVQYLDGLPLLNDKEIKKLDKEQKDKSGNAKNNKDDISIAGWEEWTQTGTSYYYTSYDYDHWNNLSSSAPKWKLSTTSTTTVQLTGSTEYNFAEIAKASLSLAVGTSWGRTYEVEFTAQPWYEYELKSACKVLQRDYEYTHDGWFSNPTYYASSHDKYGTEQWFFSHPYQQ